MGQLKLYRHRTQTHQRMLVKHDSPCQTLNSKNNLSINKLNSNGEITPPCFTPFDIPKLSEAASPHLT